MISNTADYALRAVLLLGANFGGRAMRADEIASAIGAPQNYLAKTLNTLAKSGLLTSSRGPTGGFALAIHPAGLALSRIIDVFDEPRPHTRCLLGNRPCNRARPCAAHAHWGRINDQRRAPFTSTTVADLLGVA